MKTKKAFSIGISANIRARKKNLKSSLPFGIGLKCGLSEQESVLPGREMMMVVESVRSRRIMLEKKNNNWVYTQYMYTALKSAVIIHWTPYKHVIIN